MRHYVARAGYTVAIIVFLYLPVPAQNKDSLERAVATAPDSTKFKLLFALDQAYITSDPAKSLAYEKVRLAVAEKLHDPHYESIAYIALSRAAIYLNDIPNAKNWLQKGYALAETAKDSPGMARALINLGAVSQASSDQAATLDDYLRALRILKAIRDTPLMNISSINVGSVYFAEGNGNVGKYLCQREQIPPGAAVLSQRHPAVQQATK